MKAIILLAFVLFLSACRKDPGIISPYPTLEALEDGTPYQPDLTMIDEDYESITYPDHFTNDILLDDEAAFNSANPVTNDGAALGRVLFYDKNLSANNTVACASCHQQQFAFSDTSAYSTGLHGGLTGRSSMAITNVIYNKGFFWDKRAATIEEQALMPIQHPVEMGMTLNALQYKLSTLAYYPGLFEKAFGTTQITSERIALALGQFMKSMVTANSKYDQNVDIAFSGFTAQEFQGYQIYNDEDFQCVNCHGTQNFGGIEDRIIGLENPYTDLGMEGITGNPADNGKFKSVSLRNIELTPPYMHDGRFKTLEEVVDFYADHIQAHPYLDDRLTTNHQTGGPPLTLNLTKSQRAALVAFLKTLTDYEFISNPIYSNPFPD